MNIPGIYDTFLKRWSEYQTIHIISDTHFSDKELAVGLADRPSDEELVKMINSKVGRKDLLFVLGDCGNIEFTKQLRGYKILIMGNHDAGRTNYERQVITQQFFKSQYTKQQALDLTKDLFPNCKYSIDESDEIVWEITADNMLFDEVYEGPVMLGEKLLLSHEPVDVPWAFNIHGHVHDRRHKDDKRHKNVCADVIGYTPINLNQFMKTGPLANIESIHRTVINKATERKQKRGGKKIGVV